MERLALVDGPEWAFASASSCCGQALVPVPCLVPLAGSTSPKYPFSTRRLLIGPSKPRQQPQSYMCRLSVAPTVMCIDETGRMLCDTSNPYFVKRGTFGDGMHDSTHLEVGAHPCHASCPFAVVPTPHCPAAADLVQDSLMQICRASCLFFVAQTSPHLALAGHGQ